MTAATQTEGAPTRAGGPGIRDYFPLLKWLMFTGVSAFGFWLLWRYGLLQLMLNADKSHVSFVICVLYVLTCVHCFYQVVLISKETNLAHRIQERIMAGVRSYQVVGERVLVDNAEALPDCRLTRHIRNLILKARSQGEQTLDQTLLLRGLADTFRGPTQFGSFSSDSLLKLGLLGTIIGFIWMLIPLGTIDAADPGSLKSSMRDMGDGMAVAMYTTLAGLVASILIKMQYFVLDDASAYLFSLTTDLTEVFVVSSLERESHGGV